LSSKENNDYLKLSPAALKKILDNSEVLKTNGKGQIQLDPNNWGHLMWWLDDDVGLDFARTNKEKIIDYAKANELTILKSYDILFAQFLFE
jgi:hypothetical protein